MQKRMRFPTRQLLAVTLGLVLALGSGFPAIEVTHNGYYTYIDWNDAHAKKGGGIKIGGGSGKKIGNAPKIGSWGGGGSGGGGLFKLLGGGGKKADKPKPAAGGVTVGGGTAGGAGNKDRRPKQQPAGSGVVVGGGSGAKAESKGTVFTPPAPARVTNAPQGAFSQHMAGVQSRRAFQEQQAGIKARQQESAAMQNVALRARASGGEQFTSATVQRERRKWRDQVELTPRERRLIEENRALKRELNGQQVDTGGMDMDFMWLALVDDDIPAGDYFWYSMWGDPKTAAMMAMMKQQSRGDAELEARIAAIERSNAGYQQAGVAVPPAGSVLPAGVPPEVAFEQELLTGQARMSIRMGTGSVGGNYHPWCVSLDQKMAEVADFDCVLTGGSDENAEGLTLGRFDATLIQANVAALKPGFTLPQHAIRAYPEVVFLIARADSGLDEMGEMGDEHRLIQGIPGSGTSRTVSDLIAIEDRHSFISDYNHLADQLAEAASYEEALEAVYTDKTGKTVMFYVGAANSNFIEQVEQTHDGRLKLVPIRDKDLDDSGVFQVRTLPKSAYASLQGGEALNTMTVDALFVLSPGFIAKYGDAGASSLLAAVNFMNAD